VQERRRLRLQGFSAWPTSVLVITIRGRRRCSGPVQRLPSAPL